MNWNTVPALPDLLPGGENRITYAQAVHEALNSALANDERVRVFGEGATDCYGTYGLTKGLAEKYPGRVFDTPTAEQIITGVGVGMALGGLRPIVIHPRNDFLLLALDQIANHAAKWRTMCGQPCPLTVLTVACRGWGSAAQHSQALHGLLASFPGLYVSVPFRPQDARDCVLCGGWLGPTVVCLHKWLWQLTGSVVERNPQALTHTTLREGTDVTIVGISYGSADALRAADILAQRGTSAEVIDLCWLRDKGTAFFAAVHSCKTTHRLVVVDTGHVAYGASAEIVAAVAEQVPLRGVARVGLPDSPVPANNERDYFPGPDDVVRAVESIL